MRTTSGPKIRAESIVDQKAHIIHHFTLLAQKAAESLPLAMFAAWRALKDFLLAASEEDSPFFAGDPETPCCPKRMVLTLSPDLATTTCDLVG